MFVPSVQDCQLAVENWVITCCTEIVAPLATQQRRAESRKRKWESDECKTPWSVYSRFKHREDVRNQQEMAKTRNLYASTDFYRIETSASISKPVGGMYDGPVAPTNRTNFAINLQEAAVRMRHLGVQYNPSRIHALIMKFRRPSSAVLVFSSGRVVCTGPKTQTRAIYLLNVMIGMLCAHGYPGMRIKPQSWSVQNVVASAHMPARINVKRLYESNRQYCTYDPDIFPGVSFRKPRWSSRKDTQHNITILVFDTGSLVITGAKSQDGLYDALQECIQDIWAARVTPRGATSKPLSALAPSASKEDRGDRPRPPVGPPPLSL